MSETSSSSNDGGQGSTFSVFYVILGGAALLSTVIFPITFIFALRHYRRRSLPPGRQLFNGQPVASEGDPQQEKPKIFDVYVKPGLEVQEPRFEYILPIAVHMTSESHASPTNALSIPPSALRTNYSLRSRDDGIDKAEALIQDDPFQTSDVAVLIVMPHPRAAEYWNELGEHAIGTTKLVAPISMDKSAPP